MFTFGLSDAGPYLLMSALPSCRHEFRSADGLADGECFAFQRESCLKRFGGIFRIVVRDRR
jgi:hypothetical protein